MTGAISIEVLIGLGVVCGIIVGGVTWIQKQAKDLVVIHNENAQAHEDMRTEIHLIDNKINEHVVRFEDYVANHERFVNAKTDEILNAIRANGRNHQ